MAQRFTAAIKASFSEAALAAEVRLRCGKTPFPEGAKEICFYGSPEEGVAVCTTSWLTESVDRALLRNLRGGDLTMVIDYLIQRSVIPQFVVQRYDNAPWVLMHCDLHSGNLIVDEDLKLKGIIDWDVTFAMPLQKAASWPKLLQYIPGAVPPGNDDRFMSHPEDKKLFLRLVEDKEVRRRGTSIVSKLMESSYERTFFEMSLHMKTVHYEWIKRYPHTSSRLKDALHQLDEIIAKYPELRCDEAALETRKNLMVKLASNVS